jgi:N-acetylneuraminic acid mutarotase
MRTFATTLLLAILAAVLTACTGDDGGRDRPDGRDGPGGQAPAARPTSSPGPGVGTWTTLAELPEGRSELGAVALDGLVYVAGGFAQFGGADEFLRYDPASDAWRQLAPTPARPHHAPLAAHDGTVYLVGGCAPGGTPGICQPMDTLFAYDVDTDTWREGRPLPTAVGAHAVATTDDGVIHVIGGLAVTNGTQHAVRTHQAFDTVAGTWSTLPEPALAREHHGTAHLDGVVYVAGGRWGAQGNELEAYNVDTREWTRLADAPTIARSGVAVVAFQARIYVFGGESIFEGRVYDQAERYDPGTGTWEQVTPMPLARHGLGGTALDGGIVLVGGGPRAGLSFSARTDLWRP